MQKKTGIRKKRNTCIHLALHIQVVIKSLAIASDLVCEEKECSPLGPIHETINDPDKTKYDRTSLCSISLSGKAPSNTQYHSRVSTIITFCMKILHVLLIITLYILNSFFY